MEEPSPEEPNYAKQSRMALRGLFFIAVITAMYVARDFLLPVVLASFIALTFRPTVRYLSRHYVPPWLSAALLAIVLVGGGLFAGYMLSWQVSAWIDQAPQLAGIRGKIPRTALLAGSRYQPDGQNTGCHSYSGGRSGTGGGCP